MVRLFALSVYCSWNVNSIISSATITSIIVADKFAPWSLWSSLCTISTERTICKDQPCTSHHTFTVSLILRRDAEGRVKGEN